MPINISYIAAENHVDLIFQGNLDVSISQDIWVICRNLSSCVKSCTINLSAVEYLFDSGVALLQVLYLRLSKRGIKVLIMSDCPDIRRQVPIITRMPSNPAPVRHPGQSVLSTSV